MAQTGIALFETALGSMGVVWGEGGILELRLPHPDRTRTLEQLQRHWPDVSVLSPPLPVLSVCARIDALTRGRADDLQNVALDMRRLPPFPQRVYRLVRDIRPGDTRTYGEVAAGLGEPGAAQAVGQALGRNPFAPVVPCHRVLAAGGRSGGFSAPGGLATKLALLEVERARFSGQAGLF